MTKWDGKTKGSSFGYKFLIGSVKFFGLNVSYFFCYFVAFYFIIFAKQQRNGLIQFYKTGLNYSTLKAFGNSIKTFTNFGQTLIDRVAINTKNKNAFTYDFVNDQTFGKIKEAGRGGLLLSAHLGNWEVAGNFIHERISASINIVVFDNEVEAIKKLWENKVGSPKYKIIPIKNDLTHLILIKAALDRNEFVAMHADRVQETGKKATMDFLGSTAYFPVGPFKLAARLKVPVAFVYATKNNKKHYHLTISDPILKVESPEEIRLKYVRLLEDKLRKHPNQWYNFYNYYVS